MNSNFKYKDRVYSLPSDCSLSAGNSCDTREKHMSDGSGTSYAITTFTKPQVNTQTLGVTLTSSEYPNLIEELYKWEEFVGKSVYFTYCNIPFGTVIVNNFSVSFGLDATFGLMSLSISFNLSDNIVLTNKAKESEIRAR